MKALRVRGLSEDPWLLLIRTLPGCHWKWRRARTASHGAAATKQITPAANVTVKTCEGNSRNPGVIVTVTVTSPLRCRSTRITPGPPFAGQGGNVACLHVRYTTVICQCNDTVSLSGCQWTRYYGSKSLHHDSDHGTRAAPDTAHPSRSLTVRPLATWNPARRNRGGRIMIRVAIPSFRVLIP